MKLKLIKVNDSNARTDYNLISCEMQNAI
jgi:hypothetical protein